MTAADIALRFTARRGRGDWMALVVGPQNDVPSVAHELAEELASLGDGDVASIAEADGAEALASSLASRPGPVVVSGLDGWSAAEWAHFDHLRSRFSREERTALVLGGAAFERLMQEAPNFASWLGASVVSYQPTASVLTEAEREERLAVLRAGSGRSDDEVIALASAGTLPTEPEFAEWLVLLRRGDLLGR